MNVLRPRRREASARSLAGAVCGVLRRVVSVVGGNMNPARILMLLLFLGACGGSSGGDCSFSACGGSPVGEWQVSHVCGTQMLAVSGCPAAVLSSQVASSSGSVSVKSDMSYSFSLTTN